MISAGSTPYQPVSLNREYLIGKMLERYSDKHTKAWNDLSLEERSFIRGEFLSMLMSLEESLATRSPVLIIDQTRRTSSRLTALLLAAEIDRTFLAVFRSILAEQLPQNYRKQAVAFARKAAAARNSDPILSGNTQNRYRKLSPRAQSFLRAVLTGDPTRGKEVIARALAAGMPIREVYTTIFQPVLYEIGKLWQGGQATIAQEHFVTGVVRQLLDQLHDRIAISETTAQKGRTVVAACIGSELHDIGIRMVADFFVMDGWNVYFIGANTPAKSILAAVKDQKAELVAISLTMPSHLSELHFLIRSLRADRDTARARIIVGGQPFTLMPDLGDKLGADAVATGAEDAVTAAHRLMAGPRRKP